MDPSNYTVCIPNNLSGFKDNVLGSSRSAHSRMDNFHAGNIKYRGINVPTSLNESFVKVVLKIANTYLASFRELNKSLQPTAILL